MKLARLRTRPGTVRGSESYQVLLSLFFAILGAVAFIAAVVTVIALVSSCVGPSAP